MDRQQMVANLTAANDGIAVSLRQAIKDKFAGDLNTVNDYFELLLKRAKESGGFQQLLALYGFTMTMQSVLQSEIDAEKLENGG